MSGVDYGMGKTNIDPKTGIRYGVISQNSVSGDALDDMVSDYGPPTCPKCGSPAVDIGADGVPDLGDDVIAANWAQEALHGWDEYACIACKYTFGSDSAFGDEAIGQYLDNNKYKVYNCLQSDLMVIMSPYWTYARFCSPCVPGAGDLDAKVHDGQGDCKAYCLGHDWFDDGKAPYPVYRVSDDSIV